MVNNKKSFIPLTPNMHTPYLNLTYNYKLFYVEYIMIIL